MRLLVVEDDDRSAAYLVRGLQESGHVVDRVADGETGLILIGEGIYDVVVLDRMLAGGLDGLALVTRLRAGGDATPVIMLSALAGALHRADGMRAGCDDYLGKPYAFVELLARIEVLARRRLTPAREGGLRVGDLRFDPASRSARRDGLDVVLTLKEALLLEYLMIHAGQVVTRAMLVEAAWDYDFEPGDTIIDRHIHRLRGKIDRAGQAPLIETVHGAGYRLVAQT